MFERFKRSRDSQEGATSVATRDRDESMDRTAPRDSQMDPADDRVERARFERESPGERDRGVAAGGGEADLAGDRAFEREEMARGDTGADRDTALDREHARDDIERDRADRDDRDHKVGPGAAAAAGAAGGAAAMHHHDRKREREVAEDRMADDRATARDRTVADDRTMAAGAPAARERPVTRERDLDRDGVDDRVERHRPVLAPAALDTMRARQRDRFGGIQWGSDFFGWLCAIGLASILSEVLVGAGLALGL